MKILIITDKHENLKKISYEYLNKTDGVEIFNMSKINNSENALNFINLHSLVSESETIVIFVEPIMWDKIFLDITGILTKIKDSTHIVSYTNLDSHRSSIYTQFLTSKNLNFTQKN